MAKKKREKAVGEGFDGECAAEEDAPAAAEASEVEPELAPDAAEPALNVEPTGGVFAKQNVKNGGKRYVAGDEITDPAAAEHLLAVGLAERR